MKKFLIFIGIPIFLLAFQVANAQTNIADSSARVPMFSAFYGYQFPAGDMAERFGSNSIIGGDFKLKTKSNWVFGAGFSYLFSQNIDNRDEMLSRVKTSAGEIINNEGAYASWQIFERGFYVTANFGKLIPVLNPNPNSGILLMGGLGYMQHKISIDVEYNAAPQLEGDYQKGYDKLTGGPVTRQFIGYLYMGDSRVINFYAGFELVQGWTWALRDYDFNEMQYTSDAMRKDLLFGIKVGWFIPVNRRAPDKFYYY